MTESSADISAEALAAVDLVERIRRGESVAETELWNRYSRGLLFLLRRRTGDQHLAEDLRQETFRIALEKLRTSDLDDPQRLPAYLRGIAVNLATGDWRKRARQNTATDSEAIDRIADEGAGPADDVSKSEISGIVRQLIKEMGVERDREVLRRFYVEEDEKAAICADLGIKSTHFNRVLFRAKQRFRELLLREERKGKISLVEK